MNKELTQTNQTINLYPTVTPTVYVNENKDGYEITFEMPGVSKEDIDLGVENRTLTLTTDTKYDVPAVYESACREFPVCNYAVSLDLPELADTDTVTAAVANGIMTVKIAKRAELKPRKIEVAVA